MVQAASDAPPMKVPAVAAPAVFRLNFGSEFNLSLTADHSHQPDVELCCGVGGAQLSSQCVSATSSMLPEEAPAMARPAILR